MKSLIDSLWLCIQTSKNTLNIKPKPKAKPKGQAKPKSTPKAGSSTKPKAKEKATAKRKAPEQETKEDQSEEEEQDMIPKKKPATNTTKVLKRPAAKGTAEEKALKVYKYKYKDGKWGFKVNGKEVMGVIYSVRMKHHETKSFD